MSLLFLQKKAALPVVQAINEKKNGWLSTFGVGMLFGLLDVLIIKFIWIYIFFKGEGVEETMAH